MTLLPLLRLPARHVWAALAFAGAASAGLAASADGDIWWHLAAGREMWARGTWLTTDPFSSGAAGRPWTDVHWLFQLGAYAIHARLGLAGLVVCKCLLVGGGVVALLDATRGQRLEPWTRPVLVTLLVAALVAARSLLLVRPVIVTLVCVALFIRELERGRVDLAPSRIVRLTLVQLVWSNCQGLSAIGPALVGTYAAAAGLDALWGARASWPFAREAVGDATRRWQRLMLALAACVAASLATPYGWRGLALSTALFERLVPGNENVYAQSVAENVPPFLLERSSGGELWHFPWAFALLGLALLAGGRRLRLSHAGLVLGFGGLALLANRNVLLFYWVAAPIAALHLGSAVRRLARRVGARLGQRQGRRVVLGANALAVSAVLGVSSVAAAREPSLAEPSPFRVPAESARRLAALPGAAKSSLEAGSFEAGSFEATLFSADHYGGYLIWQLYPRYRPYIDTRLVLRSAAEFAEYLELADEPERFDAFQAKHGFGYVVLPTAFPDRYLALIGHLYRSPDWKLVYTDGSEVLFARSDLATSAWELGAPATTDAILEELEARYAGQPELLATARLHLATLQIVVGRGAEAERVLSTMRSPEAAALQARARFAAGDLEGARAVAEEQLARDADDVRSLSLLSQIALTQGDLTHGLSLARRALRVDPFDAEASSILDRLREVRP